MFHEMSFNTTYQIGLVDAGSSFPNSMMRKYIVKLVTLRKVNTQLFKKIKI